MLVIGLEVFELHASLTMIQDDLLSSMSAYLTQLHDVSLCNTVEVYYLPVDLTFNQFCIHLYDLYFTF